ncbi:hypothetical protein [Nocardia sp. NPDC052112]|uniref:hypothetical protein n=1 Tax=Nocardia sp. NPDC052112 TaxID=3155646 RepID=UPI003438885D
MTTTMGVQTTTQRLEGAAILGVPVPPVRDLIGPDDVESARAPVRSSKSKARRTICRPMPEISTS